ncbi:MAG: T9SS type A sorting domain-containing protein [bacterium]
MHRKLSVVLTVMAMIVIPLAAQAVTDDAYNLIVGPGENYTPTAGTHVYIDGISIDPTATLNIPGNLDLWAPVANIDGTINGNGAGYGTGAGPGAGNYPGSGGSYGGQGGASGWGTTAPPPYGTADGPDIQMGSGGANQTLGVGGPGGAQIALHAPTLNVTGMITVNGAQGSDVADWGDGGGGGAGGGIYLDGKDVVISGALSANGGRGGNSTGYSTRRGGGGGGGGRIKVFYCSLSLTGSYSVAGGAGGTCINPSYYGQPGGAGTYYTEIVPEPSITSIVDVGNDQGRQVRLNWAAACGDDPSGSPQVTHYTIWRKIESLDKSTGRTTSQLRLAYPPGDWDFIADIPARGEDEYNCIAPTLADSNSTGQHLSTFFVSAVTANPFVFYDSAPAQGYSVDNLSPAPPGSFAMTYGGGANHLTWLESPEADFDYYSLFRGTTADFTPGPENLVVQQSTTGYVDNSPVNTYYKICAVDFNGNVSTYSLASPNPSDVPATDRTMILSLRVTSPATANRAPVEFVLPTAGGARLELFDVGGRVVARPDVSTLGAGRHTLNIAEHQQLASGVYFVRLQSSDEKITRTVVIQ